MKSLIVYLLTPILLLLNIQSFSQSRKYYNIPPGSSIKVERGCVILANEKKSKIGSTSYKKDPYSGKHIVITISFIPRNSGKGSRYNSSLNDDLSDLIQSIIYEEKGFDDLSKSFFDNTVGYDRYLTIDKFFEIYNSKQFNLFQNVSKLLIQCTDGSFFEFILDATGGVRPRYSDPDPVADLSLEEFVDSIKKYLIIDIKSAHPSQEY